MAGKKNVMLNMCVWILKRVFKYVDDVREAVTQWY